ncbi:FAD-dependent oxidoreductase [Raoultibacter timonensis]|uniref:FAD-dependent oxidoreductase n=1 Tax=Raoultibacter timonensis TaxID=1907662 RepID=UPI0026DD0B9A|nr:FAD-binding protein [Raoultibacter timonensis]
MNKKATGVSRRQFLIGAGLAGIGAAGAGLVGCAPNNEASATGSSNGAVNGKAAGDAASLAGNPLGANAAVEWSFMTPPAEIPADQITGTEDVDVLVVGCGFAGAIASTTAAEYGAKTLCIDKASTWSGRGGHITAYGSRMVKQYVDEGWFEEADYAHIVRRLTEWATGRVKEPLLWQFAKKSGACMDWLEDLVADSGLHPTLWAGYYKGPDYTEEPITHFFYDDTTDFVYLDGVSTGLGMAVLIPAVIEQGEKLGVEYRYDTPCVRLLRDGDGPVTGAIIGEEGSYTQVNAKAVIVASGDYLDDDEMRTRYQPFTWNADSRLYIPFGISTGDLHKQAMWIGGAMQESEPHCSTIHLESGAQSYNFLHVNAEGNRFMNEDVNTQSKSCVKSFQPEGKAFTIYDANSLESFAESCNDGRSGGISSDQQYRRFGVPFDMEVELKLREEKIKQGLLFQADTLEELAEQIGVPADNLKATVDRYNELCAKGNDDDFGKRPEIMWPVDTPPYFAGQLVSTLLAASGGLRQDTACHILDENNQAIENLYVAGAAGGQYFSNDYPTICPGTNHGRCLTFGRIAGINAAGGDADKEIADLEILAGPMPEADRVNTVTPSK